MTELWATPELINTRWSLNGYSLTREQLKEIIREVMTDIKSHLLDKGITDYGEWRTLNQTPRAIVQATIYGTIATLHSRAVFPRRDGVHAPATLKLVDLEDIMEFWENKMAEMLEHYAAIRADAPLWVESPAPLDPLDEEHEWKRQASR